MAPIVWGEEFIGSAGGHEPRRPPHFYVDCCRRVLLVAGVARPSRFHWTALGSVLLFAALNAGAGIYVLNHFRDPRRSAGAEPPLTAPSFSETPLVGQYLDPLDAAMDGVVGGVNEFLAFKQALPIALEFLAASSWALML